MEMAKVAFIPNTDHDGINDGVEFEYWQSRLYDEYGGWFEPDGTNINDTAVEYIKNPDVDKDNVTDGKEINGWKVKIITGYTSDNKPISKEVTLYGDPLLPYRDPDGNYIDSDEDNIPDIVESLLGNNSTFRKFARWALNNEPEIWEDYYWTIAYFYSIRNGLEFSDIIDDLNNSKHAADYILSEIEAWESASPHNESTAENATNWLRDQFNPLIRESMAPVIVNLNVETIQDGWVVWQVIPNYKASVSFEIYDVPGIKKITIISLCPDVSGFSMWKIDTNLNGETHKSISEIIDISEVSAALSYRITIRAADLLGNTAEWRREVDGPIGVVIHTIANALKMFWNFLCEVGETIMKAVKLVHDYILSILVSLFSSIKGDIETLEKIITSTISGRENPLQMAASLAITSLKIAMVGGLAFIIAMPFLASFIISMDDFVNAALLGISGISVPNIFSYATSMFSHRATNTRYDDYSSDGISAREEDSDNDESVKVGIYIALEPSVPSGIEGLYVSGGPGIEVVVYPLIRKTGVEAEVEVYGYLQTPTLEFSPSRGIIDIGLAIDTYKQGYVSYGPDRASFSMRTLILGFGIPTNANEHPFYEVSFLMEVNLFPAFQWSWLLAQGTIGGG